MYAHTCTHIHTLAGTWDYTVPTGGKAAGRKGARKGAGKGAQDGKGAGKGAGKLRIAAWMRGTLYPIRFWDSMKYWRSTQAGRVRLSACLAGYPICLPRVGLIEGIWPGTIASDLDSSSVGGLWRSGRVSKPTETPQLFNINMRVCMCMYTHISLSLSLFFIANLVTTSLKKRRTQ